MFCRICLRCSAHPHDPPPLSAEEPIHFALLIPVSGSWDGGKRFAGAAALAVERVNANKDLLPGQRLEYSWTDSGCSAQQGLVAMGKLLGETSSWINAVIGPGCSSACKVTSYLASGQNLPQISYSCTATSLSDKEKYCLFSRTVSPDTSKGLAPTAFMQHTKWQRIAIVCSTESLQFETRLELARHLKTARI